MPTTVGVSCLGQCCSGSMHKLYFGESSNDMVRAGTCNCTAFESGALVSVTNVFLVFARTAVVLLYESFLRPNKYVGTRPRIPGALGGKQRAGQWRLNGAASSP